MQVLTLREEKILNIVIELYGNTGIPVGSSQISQLYRENQKALSSATVRNTLLLMEEKGYLQKVHHSSGRIPTKTGYSHYIDNLILEYDSLKIACDVSERLCGYTAYVNDTKSLLIKHLEFLSMETGCATMLMLPDFYSLTLAKIEFVRLSPRKIMVIMVSKSSFYRQVIVNLESDISYEELVSMGNYLNSLFSNLTMYELKRKLENLLRQNVSQLDGLSNTILSTSYSCIESLSRNDNELIVEGMSNLFNEDEIKDLARIHNLVMSFEKKKKIADIIYKCIDSDISVIMNSEIADDFSFVVSPYGIESGLKGAFAVVGPNRMNYRKTMATMKYLTENVIETIINSNFHL